MSNQKLAPPEEVQRNILVQISAGKLSGRISREQGVFETRRSFSDIIGLVIPAIVAAIGAIFLISN